MKRPNGRPAVRSIGDNAAVSAAFPSEPSPADPAPQATLQAVCFLLRYHQRPLLTSELLEELERVGAAPPAGSHWGRVRQLERLLGGAAARAAGVVCEQGIFPSGRGRPARQRYRLAA